MAVLSLRIGIETEVLLCAIDMQDQCKGSLEEFAKGLVGHYNTKVRERPGQPEMRMAFDTWHASEDPTNSRYWSVVEEISIDPDEDHCKRLSCSSMRPCEQSWLLPPAVLIYVGQGGLEFASPIIRYEAGSSWRHNLHLHFQIIESYAEIMSDVTCGTHVHVSPGYSKWTLEQVKNVSRSILYFEEAFEVLLPPGRRGNRECRSNRIDNPKLKHLPDLESCFQRIQECTAIESLIHLMNAKEEDPSNVSEDSNGEKAVTERRYGFNFENLMEGKIGTIGMHLICGKIPTECTQSAHHLRQSSDVLLALPTIRTVLCGQNSGLLSCKQPCSTVPARIICGRMGQMWLVWPRLSVKLPYQA